MQVQSSHMVVGRQTLFFTRVSLYLHPTMLHCMVVDRVLLSDLKKVLLSLSQCLQMIFNGNIGKWIHWFALLHRLILSPHDQRAVLLTHPAKIGHGFCLKNRWSELPPWCADERVGDCLARSTCKTVSVFRPYTSRLVVEDGNSWLAPGGFQTHITISLDQWSSTKLPRQLSDCGLIKAMQARQVSLYSLITWGILT